MRNDRPAGHSWWPVAAFLILVFPLSWYSWLLGLADDPGNSGINPLGPLVAALLVSAALGRKGFTGYLRAIIRVRASWTTYAAAILLPVVLASASVAIAVALGSPFSVDAALARSIDVVDAFLVMFLFVALGEETGWRGWLLPRLQSRMTPLQAALAVAPVWALWHLPMLGEELPFDQLGAFLISLTAASLVLTWLTNRTGGGVLPAMLCHGMVNAAGGSFLFSFFIGPDKTRLWWINAILWAIAAIVILWRTRGSLGLKTGGVPSISPSAPSLSPGGPAMGAT
jgi:membrane protease YdiL (CAAX protease family)